MDEAFDEYTLVYSEPRIFDERFVMYEITSLCTTHRTDVAAIQWACEVVPSERALRRAEGEYLAVPSALWRGQLPHRTLVWEERSGAARRWPY